MKIELHLHTKESSKCGKVFAEDIMKEYQRQGYDVVVITDHFSRNAGALKHCANHQERVDTFLKGYRAAKKLGEQMGILVLLGAEISFHASNANDYLVYGLNEEFFYSHPELIDMHLGDFQKIQPEGSLLYQAHPFRNGATVVDPRRLFGIEVFNGHWGHDSRNDIALSWAKMHRLHAISGSDSHHPDTLCSGGIYSYRPVHCYEDLLEVLRTDDYALISRNVLDSKHRDKYLEEKGDAQ